MNYKEIKNKDIQAQLREAQLAISDLFNSPLWKEYESFIYKEEKEIDKLKDNVNIKDSANAEAVARRIAIYNIRKNFITQLKTFADNRCSLEACLDTIGDAYGLITKIKKGINHAELGLEKRLEKMVVSALHKYIGILHFIESEY